MSSIYNSRKPRDISHSRSSAFTIVELLIVIVVIAILAAISIVTYSGIQERARQASFIAALRTSLSKVESEKGAEGYPVSVDLPSTSTMAVSYTQVSSGEGYCLEAKNTSISAGATRFVSQRGKQRIGPCPVGYWALDSLSGIDDSPYMRDGATSVTALSSSNRFGESDSVTVYNGADKYTTIDNPIGQTGPVTVSVWHKRDDAQSSASWRTLLAHPSANVHHLIINNTSRNLGIFDGSWRDFGYNVPNDNEWHHFAVIYTPATSNATLYVDGVHSGSTVTTLNINTRPIGIIGNWSGGTYWAGPVDDVSIYARALTVDEITYLAQDR